MNVLYKVTLQTMRRNKVRTIVTVIGVILSTALFTAVTAFCSSMLHYLKRTYIYNNGTSEIIVNGIAEDVYRKICQDDRVKEIAALTSVGYSRLENAELPYLYIAAADEHFFEQRPVFLAEGRFPQKENELLIPEELLTSETLDWEIGAEVTLDVGLRFQGEDVPVWEGTICRYNRQTGEVGYLDKSSGTYHPETLRNVNAITYTVTGIYRTSGSYRCSYPVYTGENPDVSQWAVRNAYLLLKNPGSDFDPFLSDYFGGDSGYRNNPSLIVNWELLTFRGIFKYSNVGIWVACLAGIAIVLIFIGTVATIYSSFSISVSERTKQFGLLSSVGATKRQIRSSVLCEAFVVSVLGIPCGILLGIVGMGITLSFVGDKFQALQRSVYRVELVISAFSLLLAAGIALITVLVSAWVPSGRAAAVSALEAIRQNRDIRGGTKTVRVSPWQRRLFGMEGALAKKYYRRNRKKYRATILSLSISVMLLISAGVFGRYLKRSITADWTPDYDVSFVFDKSNYSPELLKDIRSLETVDQVIYTVSGEDYMYPDENSLDSYYLTEGQAIVGLCYVDEESYEEILKKNELDTAADRDTAAGIAVNVLTIVRHREDKNGNWIRETSTEHALKETAAEVTIQGDYKGFEEEGISDALRHMEWVRGENGDAFMRFWFEKDGVPFYRDRPGTKIKIAGILDQKPEGMGDNSGILQILFPLSSLGTHTRKAGMAKMYFKTENSKQMISDVLGVLGRHGLMGIYGEEYFADYQTLDQNKRNMILVIQVFSLGFFILLSLVAAANVFNTVSTNVALRKRDFAMLRSVGMTERQMNRMLRYECLIYGFKSLLYGVLLAAGILYLLHRTIQDFTRTELLIPWLEIFISGVGVFLIVFITMLYSVKKMGNECLVDQLKQEYL